MFKKSKSDKQAELSRGVLDPNDPSNYDNSNPASFVRMVVLDVISDPNKDLKDPEKIKKWETLGVSNRSSYSSILPRNSIVAKKIGENSSPMFVFPFFPSHLSLPCKPGESVWAIFENPAESESNLAFWFGRIVDAHQSDDVNHSHPGKVYELKNEKNAKELAEEESDEDWSEMRNAPSLTVGEDRVTVGEAVILPGEKEDIFEKLITESDASNLLSYESIPRFKKRPGDICLEGTNNTLIVLGTDRNGDLEKTEFKSGAGAIDIVAGRGQSDATFGKEKTVTSLRDAKGKTKGTEIKKELDKTEKNLSEDEGNPSFSSDRSRILVSQKTSPDEYFGLSSANSKLSVSDSGTGDAAIVIKSDKVRLIARSDVQILVTGFSQEKNPAGENIKKEESDTSKWGSITINSKGEIIIKPADNAVIKLGGEDANKAILCTPSLYPGIGGTVTATPIGTTMGGQIGLPAPGLGEWATKILVK